MTEGTLEGSSEGSDGGRFSWGGFTADFESKVYPAWEYRIAGIGGKGCVGGILLSWLARTDRRQNARLQFSTFTD